MNLDKLHKTSKAGKHLTRVLTAWPKLRTESSFTNHGTADGNLENLQTAQRVKILIDLFPCFVYLRLQCSSKIAMLVWHVLQCLVRLPWWILNETGDGYWMKLDNQSSKLSTAPKRIMLQSCLKNFRMPVNQLGYSGAITVASGSSSSLSTSDSVKSVIGAKLAIHLKANQPVRIQLKKCAMTNEPWGQQWCFFVMRWGEIQGQTNYYFDPNQYSQITGKRIPRMP